MTSPSRTVHFRSTDRGDFASVCGMYLNYDEAKALLWKLGLFSENLRWYYSPSLSEEINDKNPLSFPQEKDYYTIIEDTGIYYKYH